MARDYLDAEQAAEFLGVTRSTLYSYVSRGMIESIPSGRGDRSKLYRRADLLALKHRTAFRKDPERAASEVIEFGTPILTTSISQITEEEHSYRGRSSRELAARFSFEQVAQFLWTGEGGEELPRPVPDWNTQVDTDLGRELPEDLSAVERLQAVLPLMERRDPHAHGAKAAVLVSSAIRVLLQLTYFGAGRPYEGSVARTLAAAWGVDAGRIDPLLVMVADHELNIATFTARCVASAGSNLYQAVLGGLAALQGYKHLYGQVAEAKRFFAEVMAEGDPGRVIRRTMKQRGVIPGFHNPYRRLYAGKDPRVEAIVSLLAGDERYGLLRETLRAAESATGEHPRVDFALAVSEPLLGLPTDAVFDVIAIGRTAGMIAHVLEQYESERVIRPRARYVPKPD